MKEYITLKIDGKAVKTEKGSTVLEAARKAGADIPTLCHDERVKPYPWQSVPAGQAREHGALQSPV